eukprot:COSAG02_NODE_3729_length_6314_cov_74.389220_6_plen_79_part_00
MSPGALPSPADGAAATDSDEDAGAPPDMLPSSVFKAAAGDSADVLTSAAVGTADEDDEADATPSAAEGIVASPALGAS